MLNGYEQGGASRNLDDRKIMGELLGTFSELKDQYQTNRLELAWAVLQSLMQHIEREGVEAVVEFSETAGKLLLADAEAIRSILDEDHKNRLN